MRCLLMGCCLYASILSIPCFSQNSNHANDWFKKKSEEQEKSDHQKKEIDQLKEKSCEFFEKMKKKSEESRSQAKKKGEDIQFQMEQNRKEFERQQREFEKTSERFHERFQWRSKEMDDCFDKGQKEFEKLREQIMEKIQKQQQEHEEIQKMKDDLIAQVGLNSQNIQAHSSNREKCLNCSSDQWAMVQEPKVLVFVSFSIPNRAWIDLSKELEKVGGVFVLRGLPDQSMQILASRILKLKEEGVNAPILIDPKSFLTYGIDQVPAIVISEEKAFDKVSGHVSLKFALEKMKEQGDTKMANVLYTLLRDRV